MHAQRRARGRWVPLVAGLAGMLLAGCGEAASGGAPAATSAGSALQKPADAGQAVSDAVARTASFTDVTYQHSTATTISGQLTQAAGTIVATKTPPRVDIKTTLPGGGQTLESIQDLGAGNFCTLQGVKQVIPGQTAPVGDADPFYELKLKGSGWAYVADATIDGRSAWHVTGQYHETIADSTVDSDMVDVFIDAQTGKIVKLIQSVKVTSKGVQTASVTTLGTFVYNTGATVAAC